MDGYRIVYVIPEAERPTEKPIPPKPVSANAGGTDEEWKEYWGKRDAYYHGFVLEEY